MFKVFILFLLGTLLVYCWGSGVSGGNNGNARVHSHVFQNENRKAGGTWATPVLESVLQAHNLDSAVVGNLMEQHGFDEASLLQLLADVGQTAAFVLDSKSA